MEYQHQMKAKDRTEGVYTIYTSRIRRYIPVFAMIDVNKIKVPTYVYNKVQISQTCRRTSPRFPWTLYNTSRSSTYATTRKLGRLATGSWSRRIKSGDTLADARFQIHCGADWIRQDGHQVTISLLSSITTTINTTQLYTSHRGQSQLAVFLNLHANTIRSSWPKYAS